ncbi:uncharacterized protein CXorf58 homolog [Marmota marmota marmota]|uniref:uncharacterized protein CXorf58 homolog n=1 Tax=Marmota marmota marmota TaxID=9994 RepID=UPI002092806C|nr:uncharacterized protein CXorf58 homolog [Marmota marmota marmota]
MDKRKSRPPGVSASALAVARRQCGLHAGAREGRRWEFAFAATIGRSTVWVRNPVRGGGRLRALVGPREASKASQPEVVDQGLDLPHKRYLRGSSSLGLKYLSLNTCRNYFIIRKMSHSSNAADTRIPKSDNQQPRKGHKAHFLNVAKAKRLEISARKIQKSWFTYMDKVIFQLLKHTVCAAEHYVTYEILKKVSPLEAELIKDPSMKCKVRFRFSGERFPPFIVFKIFLHTEGRGYKYFSGKNLLQPSNEAMVDACKIMGKKKFYQQIMEDEHIFQKFKVTDHVDIVTMQDYMQYSSLLDETPASSGGRNNHWRRLNLENIPRTMMIYDIVDYAESGVISNRLQKEMKYLLRRPRTEEMRQHQLKIVSQVRCPSFAIMQPLLQPYQQQSEMKPLGRRSKQARMKVEKMRKAYKMTKNMNASEVTELQKNAASAKKQETIIISTPSFDIVKVNESTSDSELEKEEKELFAWYQDLHIDYSPSC